MKPKIWCAAGSVLSEEQLQRIHEASLELLSDYGIYSESDLLLKLFRDGGAAVDTEARVVRIPADMVESALTSAPKSFVLCGRDPDRDIVLEAGSVYFGLGGSSEPFIWDYSTGKPRQPTRADMVDVTRLGQAAPNIDFVMSLCSAGDVPGAEIHLHEYDALFRNTNKPIIFSSPSRYYAQKMFEMAAAASGGESRFRERPWLVHWTQPISPMKIGSYTEGMIEAAELGVPIMFSPGPMMGATSPATLAGTLVQVNAEALAGIVLAQIIRPGIPVIYAPHTAVMDMKTAQCTYGSPEQTLARAAVAQLGKFYGLPSFGLGGGVEANLPDAEAGAQAMMGMMFNALSGITLTQTLGTLASGLYGSMEMLMICDECVRMIKRLLQDIVVNEDTLAVDVIKEVGHGGHFLDHDHTLRHFREELFFPDLFVRQSVDEWVSSGAQSIVDVAHERVEQILAEAGPVALPDGADDEMTRIMASVRSESQ